MQYTKRLTLEQESFQNCLELCPVKLVQNGSKLQNVSKRQPRSICENTINNQSIQMSIFIARHYTIAWVSQWILILPYSPFQESPGGAHTLLKRSLQRLLQSLLFID